jgi:hypothetical protein
LESRAVKNDDKLVDSVGQLQEGQTLVYLLFHRVHNLYAGPELRASGVTFAPKVKDAVRFADRKEADGRRNLLSMPQQWKVVPAVYDALEDTVSPVGG